MEILRFTLDRQSYALRLGDVRQVLPAVAVTRLPGGPAVVEGVVDVRGDVVPLLSLRRRFGLPDREIAPEDHFILAEAQRVVLLHTDRVEGVSVVDPSAIQPTQSVAPRTQHVTGIVRLGDGLVLIHDLRSFFSQAEAEELDAAMSGAHGEESAG